jgi:hypothetical protein
MNTGNLIFQMSVIQPRLANHPHSIDDKTLSRKLSEPCSVHYSMSSGHVIVGYSDGTISLFNFELSGQDHQPQSLIPNSYQLQLCHCFPITFLTTIPIPEFSSPIQGSWLFVGDKAGVLSAWMIPKNDNPRFGLTYFLIHSHILGLLSISNYITVSLGISAVLFRSK